MPIAITLRLDADLSAIVSDMQRAIEKPGVAEKDPPTTYAPHMTIGLFQSEGMVEPIKGALGAMARQVPVLSVKLAHQGVFPGSPAVVFLGPVVTEELLTLHRRIQEATAPAVADAHYTVGNWVPHITLSQMVTDAGHALRMLSDYRLPLRGRVTDIELVRFPPVEILSSFALCSIA